MKKIIAAFDGLKISESTVTYSCEIAKQENAHLVGVFVGDPGYTSYELYDALLSEGVSGATLNRYDEQDAKIRKDAVGMFESACSKSGLNHSVHHDRGIALNELLHESTYADLLIIDSYESMSNYEERQPTRFVRDLLADVQCPVLLIPHKHKPIEKIILLYDGEPSSVYAIKLFSYVLPSFRNLDTEILSINTIDQNLHLRDGRLMKEFMKRHFKKSSYGVIKGSADAEIVKHLKSVGPNALVVLGAYHRGRLSRWLRESMADMLVEETKLPLFIAHQ